jgi:hypothetical protein
MSKVRLLEQATISDHAPGVSMSLWEQVPVSLWTLGVGPCLTVSEVLKWESLTKQRTKFDNALWVLLFQRSGLPLLIHALGYTIHSSSSTRRGHRELFHRSMHGVFDELDCVRNQEVGPIELYAIDGCLSDKDKSKFVNIQKLWKVLGKMADERDGAGFFSMDAVAARTKSNASMVAGLFELCAFMKSKLSDGCDDDDPDQEEVSKRRFPIKKRVIDWDGWNNFNAKLMLQTCQTIHGERVHLILCVPEDDDEQLVVGDGRKNSLTIWECLTRGPVPPP